MIYRAISFSSVLATRRQRRAAWFALLCAPLLASPGFAAETVAISEEKGQLRTQTLETPEGETAQNQSTAQSFVFEPSQPQTKINKGRGPASSPPPESNAKAEVPPFVVTIVPAISSVGIAYDPVTGSISKADKKQYVALEILLTTTPNHNPYGVEAAQGVKRVPHLENMELDLKNLYFEFEVLPTATREGGESAPTDSTSPPNILDPKAIKILALYPQNTEATTEDTEWSRAARAVGGVGDMLAGSWANVKDAPAWGAISPNGGLGPKLRHSSGGLSVIFGELFPPRSVTTQYAFQKSPHIFGWYERQFTREKQSASLLGVRRALALIEINPGAVKIPEGYNRLGALTLRFVVKARWNKNLPGTNSAWAEVLSGNRALQLSLPKEASRQKKIDALRDLGELPALIPIGRPGNAAAKEDDPITVVDVLHLATSEEVIALTRKEGDNPRDGRPRLERIGNYVTKASLEEYLGLRSRPVIVLAP